MKRNNCCIKCGGSRLIPGLNLRDRSVKEGLDRSGNLQVRFQKNPEAWIFTGDELMEVSGTVCCDCGFLETRVMGSREALWDAYQTRLANQGS